MSTRGSMTEMQMLLSLIHQEKYMCWTRNREDSDIVADIFWTHADSVKLLNMFHLVLIFDFTYKTNRYELYFSHHKICLVSWLIMCILIVQVPTTTAGDCWCYINKIDVFSCFCLFGT